MVDKDGNDQMKSEKDAEQELFSSMIEDSVYSPELRQAQQNDNL